MLCQEDGFLGKYLIWYILILYQKQFIFTGDLMSNSKAILQSTLHGWGAIVMSYSSEHEADADHFLDLFEYNNDEKKAYDSLVDLESRGIVKVKRSLTDNEMTMLVDHISSGKTVEEVVEIEKKLISDWKVVACSHIDKNIKSKELRNLDIEKITTIACGILESCSIHEAKIIKDIISTAIKGTFAFNSSVGGSIKFCLKDNCSFPYNISDELKFNINYDIRYNSNWSFSNENVSKLVDEILSGRLTGDKYCLAIFPNKEDE